jgi:transcriptional regulator CtsR
MILDMRDLVPWSIIYGAQNERHSREMEAKNEECTTAQNLAHTLAHMVLSMMLNTASVEWQDRNSEIWRYWDVVKKHVTTEQIDNIVASMLSNHRKILNERYPTMVEAFMNLFEMDITNRARILKALIST